MNKKHPNLNGPESVPLMKPIDTFPLTVTVFDANDNVVREEDIDYSNRSHRIWIGKLTVWAILNNYIVETAKGK